MRLGQRAADTLARTLGSWRFVICQTLALGAWIAWNSVTGHPVDPFPYILLNLALSTQAAFAAPVLQMSQNRADAKRDEMLQLILQLVASTAVEVESIEDRVGELSEGPG